MAALSVEPGTTPDTQSAASDQSPEWPVIQFCVVITRRSSVTSAIAEYLYDGHGLWCCAHAGATLPKPSVVLFWNVGLISLIGAWSQTEKVERSIWEVTAPVHERAKEVHHRHSTTAHRSRPRKTRVYS